MPQAGDLFAKRFRIERQLGEGGFARVFAATDVALGRTVAIKVLKPDNESGYTPLTRRRFMREGTLLARLRDPHTVRLFEHGDDGALYMVFEHVQGRDLRDVIDERGTLNADVAEHILRQLLASLREAHRAGVLHRDIKPENIRIHERNGDAWAAKLLDFGIARDIDAGGPALTSTGELLGTPRYMSPEQLYGRPLTPASDIYSLGMVVIEMLLGVEALPGGSFQAQLERLIGGFVPTGGKRLVGLAVGLNAVASQMTSLEPSQRLKTVDQVLEALDLGDRTTREQARPTEVADGPSHVRRATIAAVVLVAGLVAAAWFVNRPGSDPPQPIRTSAPVFRGETRITPPVGVADAGSPAKNLKPGCDTPAPFTGLGTLDFGLVLDERRWDTYVPTGYTPQRPHAMVILLNERSLSPRLFIEHGGFIPIAEANNLVLIAPPATSNGFWKEGGVAHIAELQDETRRRLCIDEKRIYVVGQGDGARLTPELLCQDWVRALVSSSYRRHRADWKACEGYQKPVLALTATRSGIEPPSGGVNCRDYETYGIDTLDNYFKRRNGCTGEVAERHELQDGVCERWTCQVRYERCSIDGGHRWPGLDYVRIDPECDGPAHRFPAAQIAWDFFERLD